MDAHAGLREAEAPDYERSPPRKMTRVETEATAGGGGEIFKLTWRRESTEGKRGAGGKGKGGRPGAEQ